MMRTGLYFTALFLLSHTALAQDESRIILRPTTSIEISGADSKSHTPSRIILLDGKESKTHTLSNSSVTLSEKKTQVSRSKASKNKKDTAKSFSDKKMFTQDIPAVLSDKDVELYRKMFRLQRNRQRSQVASLVPELESDVLMGHLIALRLLHPYTRTSYADLQKWLDSYSDHSPAGDIYTLANARKPRGEKEGHKKPENPRPSIAKYSSYDDYDDRDENITDTKERGKLLKQLKYYRQKQYYTKAMGILSKKSTRSILGSETWAQVSLKLCRSMMADGYYKKSSSMANTVLLSSNAENPEALWIAGFSAYSEKQYDKAVSMLRRLTYSVPTMSKYYAQGAWWAAKSYDQMDRSGLARVFYKLATKDPYSFYGQMAVERLHQDKYASWQEPTMSEDDKSFLFEDPVIRRVIALTQIGEEGLAQQELKLIHDRVPYDMDESLLTLSMQLNLPNTSMTLARNLRERGKLYLTGLYPEVEHWAPRGGYAIDKALVKAIIRQESAFNPYVVSRAGARGLMQLMPNTAQYIRKKQNRPVYSRTALLNPKINMMLGQDYLVYLNEQMDSNLVHMIAAYNAGPGNVKKWLSDGLGANDPMLFIESIPFSETRKYVKNVLANMWMYRSRYGESAPGLNAMANDLWPIEVASVSGQRTSSVQE